jgi:hypothetical protein
MGGRLIDHGKTVRGSHRHAGRAGQVNLSGAIGQLFGLHGEVSGVDQVAQRAGIRLAAAGGGAGC